VPGRKGKSRSYWICGGEGKGKNLDSDAGSWKVRKREGRGCLFRQGEERENDQTGRAFI